MLTDEQKARLFEVAREIFSEKPLKEITVKEIAARCDFKEKALLDDFKSAEDVLREIILQGIDETTNLFIRMVDARGKADIKLIRLVRELLRLYETHAPLFRLVSINSP